MHKDLEKFISDNRDDFDDKSPSYELWNKIEQHLSDKQPISTPILKPVYKRRFFRIGSIAASAVLLVGIGLVIGLSIAKEKVPDKIVTQIEPDYQDATQFYERQVSQKKAILASYPETGDVNAELANIDQIIEELKQELLAAPKSSREQIVKTMIENHQAKLNILNQVLEHIQQENSLKNNSDEKIVL